MRRKRLRDLYTAEARVSPTRSRNDHMSSSYSVTVWCGCRVYVSHHPRSGLTNTRVIERPGAECRVRNHMVGARLWLWELLPDRRVAAPEVRFETTS